MAFISDSIRFPCNTRNKIREDGKHDASYFYSDTIYFWKELFLTDDVWSNNWRK